MWDIDIDLLYWSLVFESLLYRSLVVESLIDYCRNIVASRGESKNSIWGAFDAGADMNKDYGTTYL